MQNREKITPSRSSAVNSPVIARQRRLRLAQFLGEELERRRRGGEVRRRPQRGAPAASSSAARCRSRARNAPSMSSCSAGGGEHLAWRSSVDAVAGLRRQPDVRARRRRLRRARRRLAARALPPRGRSCCGRRCAAAPAAAAARIAASAAGMPSPLPARRPGPARDRRGRPPPRCARCRAPRSGRRSARSPAVSTIVSGMPGELDLRAHGVARRARRSA